MTVKIEVAGYALNPSAIIGIGPVYCLTPISPQGFVRGNPCYGFDLLTTGAVHVIKTTGKFPEPTTEWAEMDDKLKATAEAARSMVIAAIFP